MSSFIGGNQGLFNNINIELTAEILKALGSTPGEDFIYAISVQAHGLLGRGSDKIGEDKYENVIKTCQDLSLDGLVLVGGAYTATDAALLSESFLLVGVMTRVITVPVDYSRDIKNISIKFTAFSLPGFDTASKYAFGHH